MLPAFIIEQVRERENEERNQPQPRVELEIPFSRDDEQTGNAPAEPDRGVVIIELL